MKSIAEAGLLPSSASVVERDSAHFFHKYGASLATALFLLVRTDGLGLTLLHSVDLMAKIRLYFAQQNFMTEINTSGRLRTPLKHHVKG